MGAEPAKRLHRTTDHPRKQALPLQSRSLGVRTSPQQQDGPVSVRQSSNSIQILVVATRVEVRTGVRKVKTQELECEFKFDTKTELGEKISFAILIYMACAMDARGRVYEVGPLPL